LKKHGVERIETANVNFDPNFHEALMQWKATSMKTIKSSAKWKKAYLLNGRLLRPSRVCVCKKTSKENDVFENMRIQENKEEEIWEKLSELI